MDELEHPPLRIPLSSLKKRPSIQTVLRARGWLNLRETAAYLGISTYILKRLIVEKRFLQKGSITVANGMYRIPRYTILELELEWRKTNDTDTDTDT